MTLRLKIFLVVSAILAGLLLVQLLIANQVLKIGFDQAEQKEVHQITREFRRSLAEQLNHLKVLTSDWSIWDDAYQFMQDRNPRFVEANLPDNTMAEMQLSLLLLVNPAGEIVAGKAFDQDTLREIPLPTDLQAHLAPGKPLLQHQDPKAHHVGLLPLASGPMLIASRPIVTSHGGGPPRGSMIMGRYLDSTLLKMMAPAQTLGVAMRSFGGDALEAEFRDARDRFRENRTYEFAEYGANNTKVIFLELRDLYGQPCLIVKLSSPRGFLAEEAFTRNVLFGYLILVGAVLMLAMLLALERWVVARLGKLPAAVDLIRSTGTFVAPPRIEGRDEVARLGHSITGMLDELHHTQEKLACKELYYRSLIENSLDVIGIFKPSGEISFISPSIQHLTGIPAEELIGKNFLDLVHPDNVPEVKGALRNIVTSPGLVILKQVRIQYLDSSWRILEGMGLDRTSDPAVGGVVLNFRDGTDRQKAEDSLQQAYREMEKRVHDRTAELRLANQKLQQEISERERIHENLYKLEKAIETASVGITVTDLEGRIVYTNPAEALIRGVHLDDLMSDEATFIAPPDPIYPTSLEQAQSMGAFRRERLCVRKDGSLFHAQFISDVIRDDDGRPIGIITCCEDITDRKCAELRLQESENKYHSLFENVLEGVFQSTPTGRLISVNPALVRISGYASEEELCTRNLKDLYIHQDERETILRELELTGVLRNFEASFRRKNGSEIVLLINAHTKRDNDGKILFFEGTVNDITERKRAEEEIRRLNEDLERRVQERTAQLKALVGELEQEIEARAKIDAALRESEKRYRTLFDDQPIGLFLCTPTGRIIDVNPAFQQMLGFPSRQISLDRTVREFFWNPHDWERWNENLGEQGVLRGLELPWRRQDGQQIWVRLYLRADLDDAGQVAFVKGAAEDITASRLAAETLRETHQVLEALIPSSPVGIIIFDRERRIILWNNACTEIFGYPEHEVLGRTVETVAPQYAGLFQQLRERIASGGGFRDVEINWSRRDGKPIQTSLSLATIPDEQGQTAQTMALIRDITERKQIEQQLAKADKLKAVGEFASGIAHDFNNLIMVISGTTELLQLTLPADSSLQRDLGTILKTAKRASELSRSLLAVARKQVLQRENLDLTALVGEMVPMFRRLIPENIFIKFQPIASSVVVNADPALIEGVLMNLILNARDALPDGGYIHIATGVEDIGPSYVATHPWAAVGNFGCLIVEDNGVGMDAETVSRIFEPFFTTKDKGKGSGLGLSTVYGVVKQHGGMVDVISAPGKGTTFRIYLPRASGSLSALPSPVPGAASTDTQVTCRGRILVVEDNHDLRILVSRYLESLGYQLTQASDGSEALEICRHQPNAVDLVMSDMVLPHLGGFDLFHQVRELIPRLPFLFTSGYSEEAAESTLLGLPGVDFIPKPYEVADLAKKVSKLLEFHD